MGKISFMESTMLGDKILLLAHEAHPIYQNPLHPMRLDSRHDEYRTFLLEPESGLLSLIPDRFIRPLELDYETEAHERNSELRQPAAQK
jgi:hypothetical protein